MPIRITFVALALSAGLAHSEIQPLPDDLTKAYNTALADLHAGKDRKDIADRLKTVVAAHPESDCAPLAGTFLLDLDVSSKKTPAGPDDQPEKRLADTCLPFHLLRYAENWGEPLSTFLTKEPKDPVAQLVAADRTVISRLIPLLDDRSPTRCDDVTRFRRKTSQPRVCDLALALIEYHGKVRFHCDSFLGTYLHQLPDNERRKVTERVAAWWEEVKDKSVAAGVRAQLPHARSYPETVWMAKTLARITEGQNMDDREFALNTLREMVTQNPGNHIGTCAADALAELGDTSAVDIFYNKWRSSLGHPGLIHDSHIAFYLCRHGGRREWELLHAISLAELHENKGPGGEAVWACVTHSEAAGTNLYAIPILGLALDRTENTGSRWSEEGEQAFSSADTACELFQKQVRRDFGYNRNGTAAERLAAIKKAQDWWTAEGRAKYSFDYIEKNRTSTNSAASPSKK